MKRENTRKRIKNSRQSLWREKVYRLKGLTEELTVKKIYIQKTIVKSQYGKEKEIVKD